VIADVDYGAGNLRSVELALERLGVPHRRAPGPGALAGAGGVILPGVGAAASAMRGLDERGLAGALRAWEGPLLGVCLGMQLLTERSYESDPDSGPGPVPCLGLIPGETRRIDVRAVGEAAPRLPHIGWNATALRPDFLFEGLGPERHFYFLHSFRVACDERLAIATTEHGEPFPAAVRSGSRVGVQFHPEKSGEAGLRVLANFCREAGLAARESR
jgi:glutamine amidotransferase